MEQVLKILILEDNSLDAEIIEDVIIKAGMHCIFHVAAGKESFEKSLGEFYPDVVLSDNSLPQYNSEEALILTRQYYPFVPFILVTGTVSEEYAVKITKSGADDYILKDRLARLPAAIQTALQFRQTEIQNKQFLQSLVESQEKYRTLINRITDAFITLDINWNLTYINRQASIMIRMENDNSIGKNLWELFPDTIESATYRAFHRAMHTQQYTCVQDYYKPYDLWQEHHIYPTADGLSIFIRDITEAKKADLRLQQSLAEKEILAGRMSAILNTLPANIAMLDSQGLIIDVNDAWKKFAQGNGYKTPDYGVGKNYLEISEFALGDGQVDGKKVAGGIKAVLDNQLKEFVFEYSCHSPWLKRWFRMIVTPFSEKMYAGAVVMHIDVTELRIFEQERLENKVKEQRKITKAILDAQEKERNIIGRELHDNVNQILAGTKLILSTVQRFPENKEKIIQNAIDNLKHAIDENRNLAHELVAPDFKDIKITEQLGTLVEGMLKKADIDITIETNGFKEELLKDEQKLTVYRIAQEQCTNILKYAGAASVVITLEICGNQFEMKIADNGKGMEKGKLIKGIGLKNIRSRLDLFNGDAFIETSPGKGFALTVHFPVSNKPVTI